MAFAIYLYVLDVQDMYISKYLFLKIAIRLLKSYL